MGNISEFYSDDHNRLDTLFASFVETKASDPKKARETFLEFKAGLERHIAWEEEILFPEFEERAGMTSGRPTEVMRMEHQWILNYLKEIPLKLAQDLPTDEDESALVRVLSPHNQKEEMVLYPAIDALLDDQERACVFSSMENRD